MRQSVESGFKLIVALILFGPLAGCAVVPDLPTTLDVATTSEDRASAAKDSGPSTFANSTWSLARKAVPGEPPDDNDDPPPGPYGGLLDGQALQRPPVGERIFLADFGPNGEMIRVRENRFLLPAIYGEEVVVGADWQDALLPGVFYQSASYGSQEGDQIGIAVNVQVRFNETFLGRAVLYAWGTVDGDTLDGQFGYVLDFTEGAVSFLGTIADQYPVDGVRVEE